jgi:hypothetical protein
MAVREGPPDPKEGGSFPSACLVLFRLFLLRDVADWRTCLFSLGIPPIKSSAITNYPGSNQFF